MWRLFFIPYFRLMSKKLFLLDAMALVYRAYYALIRSPRLTTAGKNTSAQFGFTSTLLNLLQKEDPTHIAVAFDTHAPTGRHSDYEAYKANREDTPEDIIKAVPDIKRILEGFKIPCIELDGYEADDIIGTLAREAAGKGYTVYMVTPDKDYGQLVTEQIRMYKPPHRGNKETILGPAEVCARWDIREVSQVIDMLGLMGDSVDNIPGVPGIGEKTACKLLKEYHTIENLLAASGRIKGKLGEKLRDHKEQAILSKKLATIITDVPIEFKENELTLSEPDAEALEAVFRELEFRSLGKRIFGEGFSIMESADQAGSQLELFGDNTVKTGPPTEKEAVEESISDLSNTPHEYHLVQDAQGREELIRKLLEQKEISFDTETTGMDPHVSEIVGMSFSFKKGTAFYVTLPEDKEEAGAIMEEFRPVFERKDILFIGQNIKYDLLIIKNYGLDIKAPLFDTLLAHYLIEPEGRRGMDLLAFQYLKYRPMPITELIGKKGKKQGNMRDVAPEKVVEYAGEDADITLQLKEIFEPLLAEREVERVFREVEIPMIKVLASMEDEGVKVDKKVLQDLSAALAVEIKALEHRVYQQAGVSFNLSSPKQLGKILFDKLKLEEKPKKTRTGQYATGEDILQKLAARHKIIDDILNYRELTKLKSTYVDALPQLINAKTGRIHTSFNQAVAVTGRLSSNNPNLQNIPIRTARGRSIREAFIARDRDFVLVSADYSQIELRIIASISGDEHMIAAFKKEQDIHATTAAKVYKVPLNEVTPEMRRNAKSVNFGIIYGVSAFGLSENLGISRTEAKELIDNYFAEYPAIKRYMDNQMAFAAKNGYVKTLLGRKRWLRDIRSSNSVVRGYAERNAINMPIQGTAADMIKLAMIDIFKVFKERKYRSKMVLQVHDELIFDTHIEELETIKPLIKEKMEQAMKLEVPIKVELGTGKNWLEAH